MVLYTISIPIALITACRLPKSTSLSDRFSPVIAFWDVSVPHHSDDERDFELAAAIGNITNDLVIFLMPLPTVWTLPLPGGRNGLLVVYLCSAFCMT